LINSTMNKLKICHPAVMKTFFCLCFISFFSSSLLANYADRMKSRLVEVIAAKDAGSVGEGVDGFLHLRDSANQEEQKLVKDENSDRSLLFKDLSSKTGGDIAEVARKFASGIATKAKKGHWFKKSSGDWVQK
jgi:uncharacterized protein YdbL (DUF1318 family)